MNTSQPALHFQGSERLLVLFPVGSCEQHGPLPIDTDLRIAGLLATKLEQSFSDIKTLLLPPMPFSASWEHRGLGTVALNISTISAVLHNMAESLRSWNVPMLLLLINWHGGNDLLASLASEISATEAIPTAVVPSIAQIGKAWDRSQITSASDIHAGAIEASVLQAYWPDLVPRSFPENLHCEPFIAPAKTQSVLQALGSYAVTKQGVWGAPEQANPDKGRFLVETLVHEMHEQSNGLFRLVSKHYEEQEK